MGIKLVTNANEKKQTLFSDMNKMLNSNTILFAAKRE